MQPVKVWIIDEEWPEYEFETAVLKRELPNCIIKHSTYDYDKDMASFGKDADIILAQIYADFPAEQIAKLQKCKGIAVYGGGYDRIDIKAARSKHIGVTNVQGYCAEDIADYVMASIYTVCKPLTNYLPRIEQGLWGAQAVNQAGIHRISAKTLFIAGFGGIGKVVAKKALSMGIKVMAYDPFVTDEVMKAMQVIPVGINEGFAEADFISVHIKCTEETTGIIGKKYFSLMKPTAYLINTSRGKILNEAELIEAVNQNQLAGAFLDVVTAEPPTGKEAIFHTKNINVTPHICYISHESYKELKERTAYNAIKMFRGETPKDLVN